MYIEPIKKEMIHSRAAQAIEKFIKDNELKNNDRLPSERELASMLSIGRNSLREALRTLEAKNLIEVVNGKGIFIKDANAIINFSFISTVKINFLELLDIRRTLENHVIELVIKNASNEDLDKIENSLINLEQSVLNNQYLSEKDADFHHEIYRASGNKTLVEMLIPLAGIFTKLWQPFNMEGELIKETFHLHRPLYTALRERKLKEARKKFNEIIDMDEKKILSMKIK